MDKAQVTGPKRCNIFRCLSNGDISLEPGGNRHCSLGPQGHASTCREGEGIRAQGHEVGYVNLAFALLVPRRGADQRPSSLLNSPTRHLASCSRNSRSAGVPAMSVGCLLPGSLTTMQRQLKSGVRAHASDCASSPVLDDSLSATDEKACPES